MENDLIRRQSAINAIENTDVPMSAEEWDELTDAIVSIPAVDAVEVRHGRWKHGREIGREYIGDVCLGILYEGWSCSICDCVVEEYREPLWNYCPNCGAQMMGGDGE